MKVENFVHFFTSAGFFIGLAFSVINFDDPGLIIFYTFLITVWFYVMILICGSLFMKYFDFKKQTIRKDIYDSVLDHYINEFEKREKISDKMVEFIAELQADNLASEKELLIAKEADEARRRRDEE